jgi:broad-specificity NMP kinase
MKKAILMCGVPGTGKTTMTKNMIKIFGGFDGFTVEQPEKLVRALKHKDKNFYILGVYDDSDEVFQGTDKLSMSVQPDFEKFVKTESPSFFVEGDRLVGNKTIDFLIDNGYDIKLVVLDCPDEVLSERYASRGSNQSETFLKSKKTKVSNMTSRMDLIFEERIHNFDTSKEKESEACLQFIERFFSED